MAAPLPRRAALAALAGALLAGAAACSGGSDRPPSPTGGPEATEPPPSKGPAYTLRVLGGAELLSLLPVLKDAQQATGVGTFLSPTNTLDAADAVRSGRADGAADVLWLPYNTYLGLDRAAAAKLVSPTPVMGTQTAVGVRTALLAELGWDPATVTWAQLGDAIGGGRLTFGMTDPAHSAAGLSALVALAAVFSGARSALTDADVARAAPALHTFFGGQKLTSGSSADLLRAYQAGGASPPVGALVEYESVLLELNGSLPDPAKLTVIRPADGVLTADYPLTLLASAAAPAQDAFRRLTAYLLRPEVQQRITALTLCHPILARVPPATGIGLEQRLELPFPGERSVADGLVRAYQDELRRPSRTLYLLDTSGSMKGARLAQLQQALGALTGDDDSRAENRFRAREEVTLVSFADTVKWSRTHQVPATAPGSELAAIEADVQALSAAGGTAIYSALEAAYQQLAQQQAAAQDDRFTSIVLMTDGENNEGATADQFTAFHHALPAAQQSVPVFPIRFGEAAVNQLQAIADLTGGKLFDGTTGSLQDVFARIRGYQ
ncbi:VWA domain-containing protein [Kitasatospora sp. NPDC006697]|uniref:vWA domain-containing protein n=1 Tax=Kitasatospora sp. NPDC006697 TaxID=3364020 RepID=UPI0036AACA91